MSRRAITPHNLRVETAEYTYRRSSIARAAEACGGELALAEYLGVRPDDVHGWMHGDGTPSLSAFFSILDLISHRG